MSGGPAAAGASAPLSKLRVLFLMLDPRAGEASERAREAREIEERLRESRVPGRVEFRQHQDVRWEDLSRHLLEFDPHIVHLACATDDHGALLIARASGGDTILAPALLADVLALLGDDVWCVFVSGDRTRTLAERLAEHVDVVVGFDGAVGHELRVSMATGFYRGIAFERDAGLAFGLGQVNVAAIDPASRNVPRLCRRGRPSVAAQAPPDYRPPAAPLDALIAEYLTQRTAEAADVYRQRYVALSGESVTPRGPSPLDAGLRSKGGTVPNGSPGFSVDALLNQMPGEHAGADDAARTTVDDVGARLVELAGRSAVLLGQPGSGKTWTLHRAFIAHADAWLQADPDGRATLPVPVLVSLRDFDGTRDGQPLAFRAFVEHGMGGLGARLDELVASGRLVLMCDALNEMPRRPSHAETTGADGRDLVAEVRAVLAQVPSFVVSCRVDDYRADLRAPGDLRPMEQLKLSPLDPRRMLAFIERRCGNDVARARAIWGQMDGSDELLAYWDACVASGSAAAFWDRAADPPEGVERWGDRRRRAWEQMFSGQRALIPLCREPFMLSIVCDIAAEGGDLPGNRVQLFAAFIQRSLVRDRDLAARRGEPWSADAADALQSALIALAKALQAAQRTVTGEAIAAGRLSADRMCWCLDTAVTAVLLTRSGDGIGFSHQLLQEYFAAHEMMAAQDAQQSPAPFFADGEGWWDPGPWRVTTVILGELRGGHARGPNEVARWLAPVSPEVALDVILRNGEGLTIEDDLEPETHEALVKSARMKCDEPHPHGRAAAYRVLGMLYADDRPGIDTNDVGLPDIVWCAVPGGTVDIEDGIGRQQVAQFAPFKIAQYPITYAQYKAFVDVTDGFGNDHWWTMAPRLADRQAKPGEQRWPISNHPAERVSWYDAMAYCRWLTERLREELPAGTVIRLPTEAEWQQAATGADAVKEYPWGAAYVSGHANLNETWASSTVGLFNVGQTTAVGMYKEGVVKGIGPLPLHDMSGNVWEWTLSEYAGGKSDDVTNVRPRVARGGSWANDHGNARAGFRHGNAPAHRVSGVGFRVVVAAPVP